MIAMPLSLHHPYQLPRECSDDMSWMNSLTSSNHQRSSVKLCKSVKAQSAHQGFGAQRFQGLGGCDLLAREPPESALRHVSDAAVRAAGAAAVTARYRGWSCGDYGPLIACRAVMTTLITNQPRNIMTDQPSEDTRVGAGRSVQVS